MSEAPDRRPLLVMVVDDEPVARRTLLELLMAAPDVQVVGAYGNAAEAAGALEVEEVDVLFLDIEMPEEGGFELIDRLKPAVAPVFVFVTAYDEHALRAFEVGALDYVLKPFDDERVHQTLDRVRKRVALSDRSAIDRDLRELLRRMPRPFETMGSATLTDDGRSDHGTLERIPVRTGKRIEFVDVDDLDWIEAENYYAKLHCGGRSYLLRETLTRLEARLDPRRFVRTHRSAIVCMQRVKALVTPEPGRHELILHDGTRVRVSRTRRASVMRALGLEELDEDE